MVEVGLSSKDLARLKYHFDRSLTKTEDFKYKERYELLISDLERSGVSVTNVYNEVHEEGMNTEDTKLRWKLEIIQEAIHKEEIDEDEVDDDDE